jgi:Molybdopterin-binding domain of aldehyde dehydrogenase
MLRAGRLVSVIDGGRVLNEKTARSQIIGGAVMAIGSGSPPAKHGMSPGRPARQPLAEVKRIINERAGLPAEADIELRLGHHVTTLNTTEN